MVLFLVQMSHLYENHILHSDYKLPSIHYCTNFIEQNFNIYNMTHN